MSSADKNPQLNGSADMDQGGEDLLFRLGDEILCIDHSRVQEIRCPETVTRLPNQPEFVKGLLNLRGSVIPVFDPRQRLGLSSAASVHGAAVIIFKVTSAAIEKMAGVVVDEIFDDLAAMDSRTVKSLDLDLLLGPVLFQGRVI